MTFLFWNSWNFSYYDKPWEEEIYWLQLRDKLQKKQDKRRQLHRVEIPQIVLTKYGVSNAYDPNPYQRGGKHLQQELSALDMSLPPKRERGSRGKASLFRVTSYIRSHRMDQLGFDIEPMTFYHDKNLRATRYFPPVPSATLHYIDRKLADLSIPRLIKRRLQRVLQKITIAMVLPEDPDSPPTSTPRLGVFKTMHIEQMVSTIDRTASSIPSHL